MSQNNTEGTGIVNFIMVAAGILFAAVSALAGTNAAQADETDGAELDPPESVTETLAQETQSIYIDANVLGGHEAKETKVTGETVPEAAVTVVYPGEKEFTAKADGKGQFTIDALPELEDGDEVQVMSEKDGRKYEIFFNYKNS